MMRDKFKLSICLLTYNQPEDVDRLLSSISGQLTDEVEIVIRDDSEGDETDLVVSRYSHIKNLRYIRGCKEGIDKTVVFLVEIAQGDFVWWMGDDDIASEGVSKVLNVINSVRNVGFIWANYKLINTEIKGINIGDNRLFSDPDEILLEAGTGLGFISACVLKREIALKSINQLDKYYGTTFVNLYIALFTIVNSDCCYCISDAIVICHPASSEEIKSITVKSSGEINNRAFEVFGVNFCKIVGSFSGKFKSNKTLRKVISRSFGQTWRGVLVGWSGGWDTPKNKRILLIKNFWNYPEAWVAFILFCMPSGVNRLMYGFYKKLKYGFTFK